jgi:uncharacterized protein YcbX
MPVVTELSIYPIKSCAGIALHEAIITPAGLMHEHIYDREWMVVDAHGEFLTQREFPRMALITPKLKSESMELRAPGMLPLLIPLDLPHSDHEKKIRVRVWDDTVQAYDCDETIATWISNAVGTPCRLARFHPDAKRVANPKWTEGVEAPTLFSDGYPVLVVSQSSLDDLNQKLAAQGRETLPMNRFRPNIVIDGVGAFEEDHASEIRIGNAILKPVKPCPRCPVPSIDQATGIRGPDPLDILRTYRVNPIVDGGITFGMNAILLHGEGEPLRINQEASVELDFS